MERKDFFKNYKRKIKGKQATMEIKLASFFKMKHNYCVYGMSIEFLFEVQVLVHLFHMYNL